MNSNVNPITGQVMTPMEADEREARFYTTRITELSNELHMHVDRERALLHAQERLLSELKSIVEHIAARARWVNEETQRITTEIQERGAAGIPNFRSSAVGELGEWIAKLEATKRAGLMIGIQTMDEWQREQEWEARRQAEAAAKLAAQQERERVKQEKAAARRAERKAAKARALVNDEPAPLAILPDELANLENQIRTVAEREWATHPNNPNRKDG
jgi:hypothetical protein